MRVQGCPLFGGLKSKPVEDNAANCQAALRDIYQSAAVVPLNCHAHTGQLLAKDVLSLWENVIAKAEQVEEFFRRGYPRVVYTEERVQGGQYLREPVKTRWASNVDLLESLVANRVSVEHALGRLRQTGPCDFAVSGFRVLPMGAVFFSRADWFWGGIFFPFKTSLMRSSIPWHGCG